MADDDVLGIMVTYYARVKITRKRLWPQAV
jgi:hypothetical protein